jgi:hypothetical protein
MNFTYQAGSNTATNGTAIGALAQDIAVYGLIVGAPVSAGNIILYNKTVAFSGDTSDIAAKITFPTFSTTNILLSAREQFIDFGPQGLQLDGGNLMIDQTMQVTVIWEPVDRSTN